ncbi:transforming growth factor beta-1-induced transcript 1 protein-like, partial [Rhinoderma darwinii]|uniref:transforming growth factor beta-1-induced transcript 1 protein-like n=1 Tax=Rhinoderma darwinii TaxID=43563 RepID=UPI003F675318
MEDLDALLADLQVTSPTRCPVLLTDCHEYSECEQRPPPPPYDPRTALPFTNPAPEEFCADRSHLYSTVKKCVFPAVSASVGGGLCELDRLLNELNATQFNITDEIMSQFPPSEKNVTEIPDDRRTLSASSATLELDRLMASLSDFHKQNTMSLAQQQSDASSPGSSAVGSSTRETVYSAPKIEETSAKPGDPEARNSLVSNSGVTLESFTVQKRFPEEMSHPKCTEPDGKSDLDSMLVKLQSGLKQQGIETQTKGLCESCQRPIAGQVVTALGHTWHPEHFACAHCKSLIGSTNFFEKDGRPYCEKDYFALYAPRCGSCDLPILQNLVTALGRTWHPEHFCCKICRKPIGEEGFHEKDDDPYCSLDYYRLFGTVCAGCSEPVKESYISALNGLWHPECFVCH